MNVLNHYQVISPRIPSFHDYFLLVHHLPCALCFFQALAHSKQRTSVVGPTIKQITLIGQELAATLPVLIPDQGMITPMERVLVSESSLDLRHIYCF